MALAPPKKRPLFQPAAIFKSIWKHTSKFKAVRGRMRVLLSHHWHCAVRWRRCVCLQRSGCWAEGGSGGQPSIHGQFDSGNPEKEGENAGPMGLLTCVSDFADESHYGGNVVQLSPGVVHTCTTKRAASSTETG